MEVRIFVVDECPHADLVHQRVSDAVGDRPDVAIEVVTLPNTDEPPSEFRGSPTILVDGHDPFPGGDPAGVLTCRLYMTDTGADGAPTVEQIRAAIRPA